VTSGGGSPSNARVGESSLNGHSPKHLWTSVEDLPQRWKVVVDVCHNLKTSIKTPLRAKLKPTQPYPKPHGFESGVRACLRHETFSHVNCALPAKQSRFAVQQSKPRMSLVGQLQTFARSKRKYALPPKAAIGVARRDVRFGPQADIGSILTVRTLGRCKPVAYSLTEAAVPDAI